MSHWFASRVCGSVLALTAVACAPGAPGYRPAADGAVMEVLPSFRTTGYLNREFGYGTQALVDYYDQADVDHVVVTVATVAGNTETPLSDGTGPLQKDVASSSFAVPLKFGNLHRNTTYRVRAYAYRSPGTDPADKISVDASSSIDVSVADDDRPAFAAVPVQLIGTPFAGQATTSIKVASGSVVASGDVGFVIEPPAAQP